MRVQLHQSAGRDRLLAVQRIPVPIVWAVLILAVTMSTWPQPIAMTQLGDFGDPLLNTWTLAWVAHAIATAPLDLFNANIFHPETGTLAYSETLIIPALMVAPLSWAGIDPIAVHNVLLLGAFVLSGATLFALVRHLTQHDGAALVAGVVFALYPYRIEEFPKVQLQIVWWWPLALLVLHRGINAPTLRRAASFALCAAAQIYSCVYYGVFGGIFAGLVAVVLLVTVRRGRRAAAWAWTAGAVMLALALAAPLAIPYRNASRVVGSRAVADTAAGSAEARDYLRAHPENAMYGDDRRPGPAERRLFPGYTTPLLAVASLLPPVGAATIAYLAAGVVAFDLSLGVNGLGYAPLHETLPPFQALRVPARFGMFVGLSLAVLAGVGIARLSTGRANAVQVAIVIAAVVGVVGESRMRPQILRALPRDAPVYAWLAAQPYGVVCEYPVGPLEGRAGPQDATYMYYSTRHWQPLVNGFSGFFPPSYGELLARLETFPSKDAIAYLRDRGVMYLLVHSAFYIHGDFASDVAALRADTQLEWTGSFPWAEGGRTEVFRIRR